MNNASLELGGTNWAEKDGNILGYSVGDTSGKFSPQEFTFARGSNLSATRINKAGLIVKGRENLLLQSNQFDTTWSAVNTSVTSGQSGYDGSSDAWLLETNGTQFASNIQSVSSSGVTTQSIYAKAGTLDFVILYTASSASPRVWFNLSNGTIGSSPGGAFGASIQAVGNGWYRCSFANNDTTTNFRIYPTGADNTFSTTAGSIYIQDAQLEQGLAATPYIETTSTTAEAGVLENTPRLNYTTGVANPYLLLEPSRTNLVNSSEYPTSVGGSGNVRLIGGATATYNYGISPEGLQNSTLVLGSNGNIGLQVNFTSSAVNQDWSYSFYIKGTAGETVNLRFELNPYYNNGSQFVTFTGGWQRVEQKISYDATAHTSKNIYITFLNAATATQFEIYGVQAEANASYSTSYIPTYGTSQTRAADDCYKTDASDVIGQTEGTILIDVDFKTLSGTNMFISIRPDSGNKIEIYRDINLIYAETASSNSFSLIKTGVTVGRYKIAFAYSSGSNAMYINGGLISSNSTSFAFTSTLNDIYVNSRGGSSYIEQSEYSQVQLYKERLTNAELATLTTI